MAALVAFLPLTAEAQIEATGDAFVPDTLEISPGDTVRWSPGVSAHSVKILGGPPVESLDPDGPDVTHVFPDAGTYIYVCTIHVSQDMWGVILVHEQDSTEP